MILDASSSEHVDLLSRATRRFARADQALGFAATSGTLAFVAVTDADEVIGWCWGYHLMRPDTSSMLYLHELAVAQEHRRQGHGRALLEAFVTAGKRAGATKMFLFTAQANVPARRLYESIGGGLAAHGPTASYWFALHR